MTPKLFFNNTFLKYFIYCSVRDEVTLSNLRKGKQRQLLPSLFITMLFFCASRENHQYNELRPQWKREWKTVSDFY